MKHVCLSILAVAFLLPAAGQGVFKNNTNAALQEVIRDYPNHFRNIRGELIERDAQAANFHSKIQVPGSLATFITEYYSEPKPVASWTCILFIHEEFAVSRQKFRDLYNQIRNTIVKLEGQKPFIVNGTYEQPVEQKKFTTIEFQLLAAPEEFKKIRVELRMQHEVTEWKISLVIYDVE